MHPQIRRADLADIPRIKLIRLSVRENVFNPARVSDHDYVWFVQNGPVWAWADGPDLRGFSAGDPRDGSIWALFVDPAWEGRGIGSALLEQACASLSKAGHRKATLDTEPGTRAAAFYRDRGWTEHGVHPSGQLLFSLPLPAQQGDGFPGGR